ncbi:centriolar satellite-associated tubulin polyglutamylase complex regulator 1-like isoform X2 [Tachypleus tridentatus]|uniref:centriolar satellite-associated tubulin polyglutamylase complex regulator 1-like isoform X2 n=1 Tax=Tachypleus tridentatus TaxID=6853 RepID=UPI003FD4F56F
MANFNEDYYDDANCQYLDAVKQLTTHHQENPKVKPAKFFRDYFRSVQQGGHILLREYDFIRATPYNRACVLHLFWQAYKSVGQIKERLKVVDYHSLFTLLWPDFPENVVEEACRVARIINPLNEKMITLKNFIYSFQATFCLQDFLADAYKKFTDFQSTHSDFASESVEITKSQNVNENKFLQILLENNGCKPGKVIPTIWPTREVLIKMCNNQVFDSFEDFEKTCAESEDITLMIGIIPPQSMFHKQEEMSRNDETSQQIGLTTKTISTS